MSPAKKETKWIKWSMNLKKTCTHRNSIKPTIFPFWLTTHLGVGLGFKSMLCMYPSTPFGLGYRGGPKRGSSKQGILFTSDGEAGAWGGKAGLVWLLYLIVVIKKKPKLEVETFDLPVLLHSNTHLWKWDMSVSTVGWLESPLRVPKEASWGSLSLVRVLTGCLPLEVI